MIPEGHCECGCGTSTGIAPRDDPRYGTVKGRPLRFINGHNRRKSPLEYIADEATGCWIWQRGISEGYGVVGDGRNGSTKYAHRAYYERAKGPIPPGLHIDHWCRNRACVNPDHLEAVTQGDNNRRAHTVRLATVLQWPPR